MGKIFDRLDIAVEYMVAVVFAAILSVGAFQVFSRYALNFTPAWSSEIQIFGHILIVFFAIPIGYRRGAHLHMDSLRKRYPKGVASIFNWFMEFLWAGFGLVLMITSLELVQVTARQTTPGLGIPMSYPYLILVFSGGYLLVVVVRRAIQTIVKRQVKGGV